MVGRRIEGITFGPADIVTEWDLILTSTSATQFEAHVAEGVIGVELLGVSKDAVADHFHLVIDGLPRTVTIGNVRQPNGSVPISMDAYYLEYAIGAKSRARHSALAHTDPTGLWAPFHGAVNDVLVKPGDHLAPFQPVLQLEAMKVISTLSASAACRVVELCVNPGQMVETGQILARFELLPHDEE
ncbi:acetyl-CoA carboxylase biotin carboxyl carrier protein subunit [Sinorhizobium meliloti]|uniref:acetyl-CoA carboxylase biotin carboxyl carrier protein subunit n=1 Tax=Rhizobium meliloti TaxID=382 RepID=UPI001F2F1321|nr:acetyl-CoA carboxylase biotin carboxyl carrier protein subunit [Sinorhizobium meliloti]